MTKGRRKVPGINSILAANIAFLLLIFFLIIAFMGKEHDSDQCLPLQVGNSESKLTAEVAPRNILQIYINKDDNLVCEREYITIQQLKSRVKEFIANSVNSEMLPEKTQKNIDYFGPVFVNDKHVIAFKYSRGASYQNYMDVRNELVAAYNELWDEIAQEKWNRSYSELEDKQQKAIREIYPQRILEVEPENK